jgi:hypothetical protein
VAEVWTRQELIDDDTALDTDVELVFDRRQDQSGKSGDYIVLKREQIERFLTEAGYVRA